MIKIVAQGKETGNQDISIGIEIEVEDHVRLDKLERKFIYIYKKYGDGITRNLLLTTEESEFVRDTFNQINFKGE